nr:MAG TPA: hypothetical protein [Caudoviricetes sp.]
MSMYILNIIINNWLVKVYINIIFKLINNINVKILLNWNIF